ncbi:MAG: FtsX-like permease family protein, partial [Terriglobales bacterium]
PTSVLATVGQRLEAVDPDLDTVQTGTQFLGVALFPAHVTAILLGAFGVLALALAVVGLYGVMAYSVSQRTWEFGVRLTLGASPGSLAGAVVGQGLKVALVGIVIGVGLALALSKSMAGMLYGIQPTDPVTYIAVAALLAGITVLACYWPARRASRVDPALTLRLE